MKIYFGEKAVDIMGEGVALIPELNMLCVSDLHFAKGSFFSNYLTFLPPYDVGETLSRLEMVVEKYKPGVVIALGDSFHDAGAVSRLDGDAIGRINALVEKVGSWHWITGNHDPEISPVIKGMRSYHFKEGGFSFCHIATSDQETIQFSGHYHPKTSIVLRGHSIRAPCFVKTPMKLILPSFGQFTGGLDVGDKSFVEHFPKSDRLIYLIHSAEVFALGNG